MSDPTLLRIIQLNPQNLGNPPYNLDTHGFNDSWWEYTSHAPTRDFSFRIKNEEVARVKMLYQPLQASYIGIQDQHQVKLIQFLEVRADHRRQGIGAQAISLLSRLHPDPYLVAFSSEADDFWSRIGWTWHPRKDGETKHFMRLYSREPCCNIKSTSNIPKSFAHPQN